MNSFTMLFACSNVQLILCKVLFGKHKKASRVEYMYIEEYKHYLKIPNKHNYKYFVKWSAHPKAGRNTQHWLSDRVILLRLNAPDTEKKDRRKEKGRMKIWQNEGMLKSEAKREKVETNKAKQSYIARGRV